MPTVDGGTVRAGLPAVERRRLREVVRQVHPDRFTNYAAERAHNSNSLQVLNAYVAELGGLQRHAAAKVSFFIRAAAGLQRIEAELPPQGSLGPLFLAFDLITLAELEGGAGLLTASEQDQRNFLQWLGETVAHAVSAATLHGTARSAVRDACSNLEQQYGLAAVQVGEEFTASAHQQQMQLEALQTLAVALGRTDLAATQAVAGLQLRLYHPEMAACTMEDDPAGNATMQSFVGQDGRLHVVADAAALPHALQQLNLEQAHALSRLDSFWSQQCRNVTQELIEVLGVEAVWHDSISAQSSQHFVHWARSILDHREELHTALAGRVFRFSVLLHSDDSSPVIEYAVHSSTLQVHTSCQWQQLQQHLLSAHADDEAAAHEQGRAEQAAVLLAARDALGAAQVISVCADADRPLVVAAAQRLCRHASLIAAALNLQGVSLAIDDCYEVWDSGFISIPHSFTVEDLQPQLKGMLAAPAASQPDSALCSGNGSLQGHVNVAGASELGRQAVADMSRRVTTCKCYHDAARIWDAGSRSPVFGFGPKRKSTAGRARVSSARLAYPAARWHCTCTAAPLRTMPFW